jgi:hypothetical protein
MNGMLSGDFLKVLRKLNKKLRVCSLENSKHAAGLYYIDPWEGYIAVCGVDKNYIPEQTEVDEVGHILKSGWRRVVNILLARKLTTREKVKQVWPSFFEQHVPAATFSNDDPIYKKILKYETDEENKRGVAGMTSDQMLEVAEEVRKRDTDAKREQDEMHKWELKKALDVDQKIYL